MTGGHVMERGGALWRPKRTSRKAREMLQEDWGGCLLAKKSGLGWIWGAGAFCRLVFVFSLSGVFKLLCHSLCAPPVRLRCRS